MPTTTQPMTVMPEPFEIDVRPDRSSVVLALRGELDVGTVDDLRRAFAELRALGWRQFVVDLRALSFLDSTGVHLLLDAQDRAEAGGGSLAVVHAAAGVHRVLELIGVAGALEDPGVRLPRA